MALKYDLQIFYDQGDNTRKEGEEIGWAENFTRFLRIMLRQFLGRDPVLSGVSPDEVGNNILSEVKVVIFIISPGSVNSPVLHDLITGFKEACKKQSDTGIAFASRIFKIVKFPVALSDQPAEVRALLPFDLYDYDPASGKTKEISNFFSQEAETNYWMKLVDLAFDINETISRFEVQGKKDFDNAVKKSVFLAETGPELIIQRNMIKRELLRQGYQVHPDTNLSDDPGNLSQEVKEILDGCNYSIHLMGDHLAAASGVSSAEVQNSAVSEFIVNNKGKAEGFSRLIWLSPNFKVKDERHQSFLENMRRDLEEVGQTEIFQTPLEDFKFILKNSLIDVSDLDVRIDSSLKTSQAKSVYLIYDKIDKDKAKGLSDYLKNKGISVLEPLFEGNLMNIRQLHIQNLIDFDGVVIFAGKVNEFWIKMKLLDILKSPGFGRMKALEQKAIFIDPSASLDKESFGAYGINMLDAKSEGIKIIDGFINNL
jgi:hypothetical protein